MSNHSIVPVHLAVKALRDSGYKNAAYAHAELMDNSIQAKASVVELLCGERVNTSGLRNRSQIHKLAVLDNGSGMDATVLQMALQFGNGKYLNDLSGIGRFGMGLPSSSISQARRVDVWTWQAGPENAIYSYIDLDEINEEILADVPDPVTKPIDRIWREVGGQFGETGTLVVWSKLDRILWRTANAIIKNSELLIGRMYRYFLADERVKIRLANFEIDAHPKRRKIQEKYALPNDPLYLLPNTSCPAPWDNVPMFTQADFHNSSFSILMDGQIHKVSVRFAYAKEEARKGHSAGREPHGRHANNNKGVSIVRAGRELDLDTSWSEDAEALRDRWWGAEISFPPDLDELFGVTNNKQSARNFSDLAKTDPETLKDMGLTWAAAKDEMHEVEDPRLPLAEIVYHIRTTISTIRSLLRAQGAITKNKRHTDEHLSEEQGTLVVRDRIKEGYLGQSDEQEAGQSAEEREKEIASELVEHGATPEQAQHLAAQTVNRGLKYTLTKSSLSSPAFFDVRSRGGSMIVSLNVDHPAYKHSLEILQQELDSLDESNLKESIANARKGLELLLFAWARYEDEQPDGKRRLQAQEVRWDWGRMARDFLDEAE